MKSYRVFWAAVITLLAALISGCGSSNGSSSIGSSTPVFSSTPPTAALEGQLYSYTFSATDAAGGTLTYALTTGPSGAALSGTTLKWTPTHQQSRTANNFVLTATSASGSSAEQTWEVSPAGNIQGTYMFTYVDTAGNTTNLPINNAGRAINALVPDGSGLYTEYGGEGAFGVFTIPGVPAGTYWLQFGNEFNQITTSNPVLGIYETGRTNGASGDPILDFTLSGFNPSLTSINWEWYVPNLPFCFSFLLPGGTSLSDGVLVTSLNIEGGPLMDATQGDAGYFVATETTAPDSYSQQQTLAYSFGPDAVSTPSGSATAISGTVSVENQSVDVAVARSQFAALRPDLNPNAVFQSETFETVPALLGNTYGLVFAGPSYPLPLLTGTIAITGGGACEAPREIVYQTTNPATSNFDLGSQGFSNPFAGSTAPLVYQLYDTSCTSYSVPGVSEGPQLCEPIFVSTTKTPESGSPLAPSVGPISGASIAGVDFYQNQTGISATPAISWSAPFLGTPTIYYVLVQGFYPENNFSEPVIVGTFATTGTQVTIPAGLLVSGVYYVALVEAYVDGSGCLAKGGDTQLCPPALNSAGAWAMSGTFTVSGASPAARRSGLEPLPSPALMEFKREQEEVQKARERLTNKSKRALY